MRVIDSIQPPAPAQPSRPPRPAAPRQAPKQAVQPKPTARSPLVTRLLAGLKLVGFLVLGTMFLAICTLLGELGQLLLLPAALVAVICKLSSRLVFGLALLALVYLLIVQQLGQEAFAHQLAALVYLVLAAGVVVLTVEIRRGGKLRFRKHYNNR